MSNQFHNKVLLDMFKLLQPSTSITVKNNIKSPVELCLVVLKVETVLWVLTLV